MAPPVLAISRLAERAIAEGRLDPLDYVRGMCGKRRERICRSEPLLLLRHGFTSREWFDAACRAVHAHPRGLLESGAPSLLIALARAGLGIAVVPSTVRFARARVRPIPILHARTSLGRWVAANWDPRRFLAPYAERFVDSLATYTAHHLGREFRQAPPIPLPPAARD